MATVFGVAYKVDASGLKKAQSEFGQFTKGIKSALATVGVGLGIAEVTSQLRDAVKAASDDAKSQKILADQLRNSAGATQEQIASVEDAIAKMSVMSAVADDQLRPAMASLVRSTGDVSQAQDLLSLSLDVSAATGKDLNSVAIAIGKAISGQTSALFRMIPGLKGSSDWMGKLKMETNGMAAAAGSADPFMKLKVIFDEVQESIGKGILPALQEFADMLATPMGQENLQRIVALFVDLTKWLGDMLSWVAQNTQAVETFVVSFLKIAGAIGVAQVAMAAYRIVVTAAATGQALLDVAMGAINPAALAIGIAVLGASLVTLATNTDGATNAIRNMSAEYNKAAHLSRMGFYGGNKNSADNRMPLNPMPGTVYTYYNFYDGGDKPAVWWTMTWDGKSWSKPKRVTMAKTPTNTTPTVDKAAEALKKRIADIAAFKKQVSSNLEDLIPEARVLTEVGDFQQRVISGFEALSASMQKAFDNKLITAEALAVFQKYAAGEQSALTQIAKARDVLTKKIDIARSLVSSVRGMANITQMVQAQSESVTESYTKVIDGVNVTISKTMEVAKATDVVASYKAIIDKTKIFASNLKALKAAGLNGQLFSQIVSAGVDAGGDTAAAIVAGGADTISALNDLFGQLDAAAGDISATATDIMYQTGLDVTNGFIDGLLAQDTALQNAATTLAQNFNTAFKAALNIAVPSSGGTGGTVAQITAPFVAGGIPGSSESGTALGNQIVQQVLNPIKTGADQIAASFDTSGIVAAGGFMPSNYGTGAAGSVQGAVIDAVTIAKQIKANTGSNLSVTYFTKAVTNAMNGLEGSSATMQKWTNIASNYLQSAMASAQPTFGAASVSPTYNVTVNAGLGADGNSIGVQLVGALKQYERTNGAVWQPAS